MEIKTRELGKINPKKKFQNKEQAKTLKELSEVEIGNQFTKLFKVTIVKDDRRICRHFYDDLFFSYICSKQEDIPKIMQSMVAKTVIVGKGLKI